MGDVTELLVHARAGDAQARDELFASVYDQLLAIARGRIARSAPSTLLDAPSLVSELFLKLHDRDALAGADRNAFLAFASTVMRNVVFDLGRERLADKRGGGSARITLLTDFAAEGGDDASHPDLDALDAALAELATLDPRLHRVVELRYFGGLGIDEIAEVTGSSPATVKRDWTRARACLYDALTRG